MSSLTDEMSPPKKQKVAAKELSAVDENSLICVADNIRRKISEKKVEISKSQDNFNICKESCWSALC